MCSELETYSRIDAYITIERLKKVIERFEKDKEANILFYELRVETGNAVYIKADNLIKTIDRLNIIYRIQNEILFV